MRDSLVQQSSSVSVAEENTSSTAISLPSSECMVSNASENPNNILQCEALQSEITEDPTSTTAVSTLPQAEGYSLKQETCTNSSSTCSSRDNSESTVPSPAVTPQTESYVDKIVNGEANKSSQRCVTEHSIPLQADSSSATLICCSTELSSTPENTAQASSQPELAPQGGAVPPSLKESVIAIPIAEPGFISQTQNQVDNIQAQHSDNISPNKPVELPQYTISTQKSSSNDPISIQEPPKESDSTFIPAVSIDQKPVAEVSHALVEIQQSNVELSQPATSGCCTIQTDTPKFITESAEKDENLTAEIHIAEPLVPPSANEITRTASLSAVESSNEARSVEPVTIQVTNSSSSSICQSNVVVSLHSNGLTEGECNQPADLDCFSNQTSDPTSVTGNGVPQPTDSSSMTQASLPQETVSSPSGDPSPVQQPASTTLDSNSTNQIPSNKPTCHCSLTPEDINALIYGHETTTQESTVISITATPENQIGTSVQPADSKAESAPAPSEIVKTQEGSSATPPIEEVTLAP